MSAENWRYVCPRGHTTYEYRPTQPASRRYYCNTCTRFGHEPHFRRPVDLAETTRDELADGGSK